MKFATFRLGKTSVTDIRTIDATVAGVLQQPLDITVSCTQLPEAVDNDTFVIVWLGSDNSKGSPTAWKQGFKAFGRVLSVERGEKFNDESNTIIRILFVFKDAINRLDVLRDAPVEYYWCSALPVIGLDDHSNQTARVLERKSELCRVEAFFSALNKVDGTFKKSICQIDSSFMGLFCESFKKPQALEKPLREGFIDWLQKYDEPVKTPKHAKEYADTYLYTINKDPVPGHDNPCVNIWNDLYKFLYGKKAERDVFHVKGLADFRLIYDDIARVFAEEKDAGPFEVEKFEQAYAWAHAAGNKGHVRASYRAYVRYLEWREAQADIENADDSVDVLSQALKLFRLQRNAVEWCADNTDGDTTNPQAGYVANAKLRAALPMTNNLGTDAQVIQWFKDYAYPDGKGWLDGIDTNGCAAFGGYINYLVTGGTTVARPAKFTRSLESAVKAIVKPESECFHNKDVHDALKFLGLTDGEFSADFTDEDYQLVKSAQIVLKRRLKKLIPNGQIVEWDAAANPPAAKENNKAPDFLTVNEFLWFVKMHFNEIENKTVEKKMEPAKHKELPDSEKNKKPVVNMADSDDVLLLRLRAALRTKPFAILAGHSGTGKSRMVRKLAYMTCNDEALRKDENGVELKEPGNFKMIQVKPNWHDSCDLLGYYSELGKRYRASEFVKFICKAYAYPNTPFFVCLDEMNLAPVEQYFAEYLSAIESRKLQNVEILEGNPLAPKTVEGVTTDELVPKTAYEFKNETGKVFHADWVGCETPEAENWLKKYGLTIPRNLFVVGTVNMDESTNQFSRKVLDRAMTIEMTDADFDAFGTQPPELNFATVPYMGDAAVADLLAGKVQAAKLSDDQKNNLNGLKSVLSSTSFAVAYRFANEYALYEDALKSTVALSVKPAADGAQPEALELPKPEDAADAAAAAPAAAAPAATAQAATVSAAPAAAQAATASAAVKPAIPSAFDDMVLMKVLPRISGDESDVKRIFYEDPAPDKQDPRPSETAPAKGTLLELLGAKKDTASVRKIKWILARGGSYLSFWP